MARNTDFIGFTFNGRHSSEFNIYSVSDGSRYQDVLVPNPIDYTEQVPGGVGQYYFGSDMDIREFPLSIAYDKLTEVQVRELRNWLAPDVVGELIFDERPYKTYTGKISTSPGLSFICFDSYNKESGRKERIYKGEGSINFVCYYPLGVVSGDKKQLGWYREQIDDRVYRSIGGSSSIIEYKLGNNEIAIFEKIKGNTLEIGSGEKGPDNPYTLTGVQPTAVTVCGRNLLDLPEFRLQKGAPQEKTTAVYQDGKITVTGANNWAGTALIFDAVFPPATYCITKNGAKTLMSDSNEIPRAISNSVYKGYGREFFSNGKDETLRFTATKPFRVGFVCAAGDSVVYPQIEIGDTATPYTPYTGQTVPLPALAPLYGDGTVCDEYDAVSGVETRRWKQVVFDGTEAWSFGGVKDGLYEYVYFNSVKDLKATNALVCTHYSVTGTAACISALAGAGHIYIKDVTQTTVNDFKTWLAAQSAAGTPVTVVYQLDEPVITKKEEVLPFSNFLPSADSGLIINANPEYYNYFTDSNANISLRLYGAKYSNIDEWALSTGMIEDLDTTGVNKGYDHYITLPDNSKGIQLFNPGDKETDFILSFNKPTPMNDILFTLSNGEQFMLNLRSSDTDVEDYGAVSDAEKRIAAMTGGVITIDTKKNRIMYKYGTGENVTEESIYFALKKGQFFKIPKNRTSTGGYNLVIGTTSNIETDSIKISYDYLYY